jgi:hypothetical protein
MFCGSPGGFHVELYSPLVNLPKPKVKVIAVDKHFWSGFCLITWLDALTLPTLTSLVGLSQHPWLGKFS